MENLIDYAGFDALDAILTQERVVAIAMSNLVTHGHSNLDDIHRKILGL